MKVYTSNADGEKLEKVKQLDMGILIASSPNKLPSKNYTQVVCALDNGAFSCWKKGYPFMEFFFLKALDACYRLSIPLTFIVTPDLVGQGLESLRFSEHWASERLCGCPVLALAVQDGMEAAAVKKAIQDNHFSHIFVGGTLEWKWDTVVDWVNLAHSHNLKCHVGRVGSSEKLDYCRSIGVDSVDSSSFVRNNSWDKINPATLFQTL